METAKHPDTERSEVEGTKIEKTGTGGFSHPPLFIDLLKMYKQYYSIHQNLPKLFRVTVGEHILLEMAEAMKLIVMANFNKKNPQGSEATAQMVLALRGKIEVLKAYFLIGWEMKFISHGFYALVSDKMEEVSKQAYSWGAWLEKLRSIPNQSEGTKNKNG